MTENRYEGQKLVWSLGTYIGYCCQEWVLPRYIKPGRCGKCGKRPKFLRTDK